MDCIVLAGGAGVRVKEFTQDLIPKILIPIHGVPFIDHLINTLLLHGVRSIVFAAGVHGDQIVDYLETKLSLTQQRYGFYQAIVEDYPRGSGGAVKCALNHSCILSEKDDLVMVVNGDTLVFHPRLVNPPTGVATNYIWGTKAENDGSLGSINVDSYSSFNYNKGTLLAPVKSFSEKESNGSYISNGWYCLEKSLFHDIPDVCSLEYDLLPKWVNKHRFYLVDTHPGDKIDIGTSERIVLLHK